MLVTALDVIRPSWFDEYPQYFLQYFLLILLGTGFLLGGIGVIKREQPRWLSRSGLLLTLFVLGTLTVIFHWLED